MNAKAIPQALSAITGLASIQAQSGQYRSALEYACFVQNHPNVDLETKECASACASGSPPLAFFDRLIDVVPPSAYAGNRSGQ